MSGRDWTADTSCLPRLFSFFLQIWISRPRTRPVSAVIEVEAPDSHSAQALSEAGRWGCFFFAAECSLARGLVYVRKCCRFLCSETDPAALIVREAFTHGKVQSFPRVRLFLASLPGLVFRLSDARVGISQNCELTAWTVEPLNSVVPSWRWKKKYIKRGGRPTFPGRESAGNLSHAWHGNKPFLALHNTAASVGFVFVQSRSRSGRPREIPIGGLFSPSIISGSWEFHR